jgi:hypothetical protein
MRNRYQDLLQALSSRLGNTVTREHINFIEIRTEKHGACYHVARVDVSVAGQLLLFAVNVAASPEAEPQLHREFHLLNKLHTLYNYNVIPQVYFQGAGCYAETGKPIQWLQMFVGEWFQGFYEFHLHQDQETASIRLNVWDLDRGSSYLSEAECVEVYRQAAKILALYYDWHSSEQIYPWHHAAGDFIVNREEHELAVRLVAVRSYRSVVDFATTDKTARQLALLLFFLHLTFQMRLDRVGGVGAVAWAADYCLQGIVSGFFQGLGEGRSRINSSLPPPAELKDLFCSFSKDEWLQLLVEMLATYSFAGEELALIRDHADSHIDYLQRVLASTVVVK